MRTYARRGLGALAMTGWLTLLLIATAGAAAAISSGSPALAADDSPTFPLWVPVVAVLGWLAVGWWLHRRHGSD